MKNIHFNKILLYTYLFHKIGLLDGNQKKQIENHYIKKKSYFDQ
jgi:hypothetical protein